VKTSVQIEHSVSSVTAFNATAVVTLYAIVDDDDDDENSFIISVNFDGMNILQAYSWSGSAVLGGLLYIRH